MYSLFFKDLPKIKPSNNKLTPDRPSPASFVNPNWSDEVTIEPRRPRRNNLKNPIRRSRKAPNNQSPAKFKMI